MSPVNVIFYSLKAVKDPSFGWLLIVDPHTQGDNVGKSLSYVWLVRVHANHLSRVRLLRPSEL